MLTLATDKKTAAQILSLIKEEETRSEDIKRQARTAAIAAADAIDASSAAAEQSFNREQVQEQEQEQEKEKEKEEEKIEEPEEEEFVKQKYSREDEESVSWDIEMLKTDPMKSKELGFYKMNNFAVFKNLIRPNEVLKFPEFLLVSKNHFRLEWMLRRTMRRLKNVVVVMEWSPAALQLNLSVGFQKPSEETVLTAMGTFVICFIFLHVIFVFCYNEFLWEMRCKRTNRNARYVPDMSDMPDIY